jgi:O-antigen ligase
MDSLREQGPAQWCKSSGEEGTMASLVFKRPIQFSGLIAPALIALALGGSVVIGLLLMPAYGDIVLWVLLGIVAAVLALLYPALGVSVLCVTLLAQNLLVFNGRGAGASTGVKLLGMAVFAAWIIGKVLRKEAFRPAFTARTFWPGAFYIAVAFGSILWSVKTDAHVGATMSLIQLLMLAVVVFDVVNTWQKFEWIMRCLVVSGLIAAVLTITQGQTAGVDRAGGDITGNENATAAALSFVLPLAFGLMRVSKSYLWRGVGLAYIAAGILGIILTYSRTSYVGVILILGFEVLAIMRARPADRAKIIFAGVFLAGVLSFSGIVPWDRVLERSSTINTDLSEDSQAARVRFWKGAILMFLDHPLLGVGYDNFGFQFIAHYQFHVEGMDKILTKEPSHHNTVYGTMGELGIVGIGLWAALNLTAVANLVFTMKRQSEYGAVMAQSVLISLITIIIYGFVQVVDNQKIMWVLLGLSDAARRLTLWELQRSGQTIRRTLLPAVQWRNRTVS